MSKQSPPRRLTRRGFLKIGGGAVAAAAGARFLPGLAGRVLSPITSAEAADGPFDVDLHMAASDGWVYIPGSATEGAPGYNITLPDPMSPSADGSGPGTAYAFGFRNVTGFTQQKVLNQKGKVQGSAPLLGIDELDRVRITLTNLGLAQRPDLTDSHTIHFHGFRQAIPLFDGVPEMSIAVPIGRDFPYFYKPHDPGTYMWHCHFEDVEHVSMGMTGIIYVRPVQNRGGADPKFTGKFGSGYSSIPAGKYAYNDLVLPSDTNSTAYDREFGMFLSELWTEERFRDAHIQENDWSDYDSDVWLLNGRTYPDTLAPGPAPDGSGADPITGDLIVPPTPYEHLQYQPISSLVNCNAGDRVLLRFVDLGYQQHAMTLAGISMKVVGKDATLLRGRDNTFTSYYTDTVYIGPGESTDAIFVAPPHTGAGYDTYLLYNRNYGYLHNPGLSGLGGQVTEIHVYAAGTLPAQTAPNT